MIETFEQPCVRCGQPIRLEWDNGLVPSGDAVLVAYWVFHASCWDRMLMGRPPSLPVRRPLMQGGEEEP